jgi:hypothetical protein
MARHWERSNVRYWHIADIDSGTPHVCSLAQSGHPKRKPQCLLMTQIGLRHYGAVRLTLIHLIAERHRGLPPSGRTIEGENHDDVSQT